MRVSRWLSIALLLVLIPGCIVDSDDPAPTATRSSQRSDPSATAADARFPAATTVAGHVGSVSFMAWSPDGTLLATAAEGFTSGDVTPCLWDASGGLVAELTSEGGAVTGISWSADSSLLAVGNAEGVVRLWNRDGTLSSEITLSDHVPPVPVAAVAWSPFGDLLATGVVQLPDLATPGPFTTLPAIVQLWEPDGSEVRSFEIEHTFRGVVKLAWSGDGSRLAASGNDIHVWDMSGEELFLIEGGEFDFRPSMAFSPSGDLLAFTDVTGTLHIHSVAGAPPLSGGSVAVDRAVVFSPDSALVAVATDNLLIVLATDDPIGQRVNALTDGGQSAPAWSPDSRLLAAGVARRAVHVTTAEGESVAIMPGCEGMVTVVSWSPNGSRLAAGLADGQVCLWDFPVS